MWAGLVDLLYPPTCSGCGASGTHLCPQCLERLVHVGSPICFLCGDPLLAAPRSGRRGQAGLASAAHAVCPTCAAAPPEFAVARSVFAYEGPIREAIHALKYRGQKSAAGPLARLLAEHAPDDAVVGVEAVIPVPLHPARLATRGFNQAELLARPLAVRLGAPCLPGAIRRVRQESPQVELDAATRRRNVVAAFEPGPNAVPGVVLLVDDVFSTGSTAAACARVLRRCGARSVKVLTLARAILRANAREPGAGPIVQPPEREP